jgi:hypothetical protein
MKHVDIEGNWIHQNSTQQPDQVLPLDSDNQEDAHLPMTIPMQHDVPPGMPPSYVESYSAAPEDGEDKNLLR